MSDETIAATELRAVRWSTPWSIDALLRADDLTRTEPVAR